MRHLLVALAALVAACSAGSALQYEPAQVRLRGVIETEVDYGPPGFGQTPAEDERFLAIVLRLDAPDRIEGQPGNDVNSESFDNVTRIQLVQGGDVSPVLAGRRVIVVGRLYQPTTGQWVTDLGMQVDEIIIAP